MFVHRRSAAWAIARAVLIVIVTAAAAQTRAAASKARAIAARANVAEVSVQLEREQRLSAEGISPKANAENLAAHIDIVRAFGMRCIVAVNRFPSDTERELGLVTDLAMQFGADGAVVNDGFARGGDGSIELAEAVLGATRNGSNFAPIYPPTTPIREQIQTLAHRLYGAADVEFLPECQKRIDWLTERGMGTLPVCMSKTHLSLSHDPSLKGRPRGFTLPIRNVYPSAGAGFIVALAGDIQLMPGLGKEPAYTRIELAPNDASRAL